MSAIRHGEECVFWLLVGHENAEERTCGCLAPIIGSTARTLRKGYKPSGFVFDRYLHVLGQVEEYAHNLAGSYRDGIGAGREKFTVHLEYVEFLIQVEEISNFGDLGYDSAVVEIDG